MHLRDNRIKFSDAYLGTGEIGLTQAHNVWTYAREEGLQLIKDAFAEQRRREAPQRK